MAGRRNVRDKGLRTRASSADAETADTPFRPNRVSQQVSLEPEAQEAFIQLAAHELRTPLTVLYGMLQLVLSKHEITDAECRPLVETAVSEARRIQAIVLDLTEVTRLRIGEVALRRQPADLNDTARAVCEQLQATLPDQRIRLKLRAPLTVLADPVRLQQALAHVVSHVAERAPSRGVIEVQVLSARGEAIVQVVGQGPSLRRPPTGSQAREQRDPIAGSAARLGLRLYVAEQLMRLHGGQLDVAGEPDVRLTVRLSLPAANAAER